MRAARGAAPSARVGANPSAKTSYGPAAFSPFNGWKTTLKPACGSGARFQEPWNAMNAPFLYFAGSALPV